MDNQVHNQIVSFIWGIADDCLRDIYVRGKYRDVILPMTVIRRLDAMLEGTKTAVLDMKKKLDAAGIDNQWPALCNAAGQAFCNASPFLLRDLTSRAKKQTLKADFEAYLDGFSPNVQEILEKFKFRNQIQTMIDADILGSVIEKFISSDINLSPNPVYKDEERTILKHPGLDNHGMGTVFEELIRKFNEENNEEAGEHWTPRDVVELMADLIFMPVADQIKDATYSCYDGACGTGGMLTVAQERLLTLAAYRGKKVSIHLFGQEINPETYAICKADMLLKGEGEQAEHISYGSTLSMDGNASRQFDFMLSNPPYGKSWKTDAEKMGGKKEILDSRFNAYLEGGEQLTMIPRVSDGQLLFLLNNVAKMKKDTPLGSRVAELHNGASLSTGNAGQGESNARRYLFENDLVEAIIQLPGELFYNTPSTTYIWILSNKKSSERHGKVQLIDASSFYKTLRQAMGNRTRELTPDDVRKIQRLYLDFSENEFCRIFPNSEFAYTLITVERPQRKNGVIVCDKKGNPKADKDLTTTEKVPCTFNGGIQAFFEQEILPYAEDAWINRNKTAVGYEVIFAKYFYEKADLKEMEKISDELSKTEATATTFFDEKITPILSSVYSKLTEVRSDLVPSPIQWLKSVPANWDILYLFQVAEEQSISNKEIHNQNLLSLSYGKIKNKDINTTEGLLPASFDTYQIINNGNIILRLTDLQNDHKSLRVGLATQTGIITSAYTCLKPRSNILPEYLYLILHTYDIYKVFYSMGGGVRQSIGYKDISKLPILLPPIDQQQAIVNSFYVAQEKIESNIDLLNKQIELLKEYKTRITVDLATGIIPPEYIPTN